MTAEHAPTSTRDPVHARAELAAVAGVDPNFASPETPGVEFEAIGPVELKGLTETVSLHVARRA